MFYYKLDVTMQPKAAYNYYCIITMAYSISSEGIYSLG